MLSVIASIISLGDWLLYQLHAFQLRREAREAVDRLIDCINREITDESIKTVH